MSKFHIYREAIEGPDPYDGFDVLVDIEEVVFVSIIEIPAQFSFLEFSLKSGYVFSEEIEKSMALAFRDSWIRQCHKK